MNIEYPYNIKSLTDSLKSSNRFGIYPIGKFNAWHGGIHIEGDSHVKCIADGRVIAYRIPTKYFYEDIGNGKNNPKYSNGFVLMQHYYKSEEGLEFTFYSLYNHLMSKKDYEKDDYSKKKIPDVLAEFSYKVSDQAKDAINGLEVYKLNSEKELDRTNPVFLKYKTTVDTLTNNGKEILLEKDKRYKKIKCKDYEGTTHSDVYVSKGLIVNGKANYKGDKSPKKGVIVYEEAKDTSEQLRIIEKSTKIKIDKKKSTNKWLKLEDEEGFIKNDDNLTKTKTIDEENLFFDKVVKTDGLLKAGTIIGHTGLFGSSSAPKYRAAHVEVFSFEDPKDFLKGGKDSEKEENKKFLKIDKGAELLPNIKKSISIKKHTPVKILEIDDNYCKIQIIKPSAEVFYKHLYDGYDNGKDHYTIKDDYTENIDGVEKEIKCYEILKGLFGKYLKASSKLYFVDYVVDSPEKREAEYRPEHHDQTFWVKNNTAIQKENAESTLIKPVKNDEFILAEDITEYYISKPSTESDTIITKEILRINSASIPKHKDGEKQYYKITYNKKEGWIKTDDTKIKKISAFNWEEFGFETMDAGDEYCYSVKDVENNIETSPFLEKIWKTIDGNNDNIIDENEWNRAKNAKVLSLFSKLVCKHKSEWSYTESEIEKEIKEYYKIGLNQATGDKKKNLEKKQDENIALLKKRVKNTCFWDKVEKGEQENKNSFSNLTAGAFLAIIVYNYYTKDEKKEADKKNIRNFKTSQKNVWHFHPIAFVEHMKLNAPSDCYCHKMGIVNSPCGGKGKLIEEKHYDTLSQEMGVEKNVFKAVAKVESGGRNSFISKDPQLSKILYERHKAYKHTKKQKGKVKADELQTSNDNLFNKARGGYKGGIKEHERLKDASELLDNNRSIPIMSASWGKFQVLGEYYTYLYDSAEDLEKAQNMCEIQQFRFFRTYLEDVAPSIINAMKAKDWKNIARLYNGPRYYENDYDNKMKKAYEKYNNS